MTNSTENTPNSVAQDTVSIDGASDAGVQSATLINDVCNIATANGIEGVVAPVVVDRPDVGDSFSLLIQPGKEYFLDFEESDVAAMVQDGDNLLITLEDGGSILLENFMVATNDQDLPAKAAFRDPLALSDFAEMLQVAETEIVEEPQAELREVSAVDEIAANVEPAAGEVNAPEQLAQIEPAAGEDGGAGGDTRGGFGFQSSFDASGVDALNDIGAIGATVLQYNVGAPTDDLLFVDEEPAPRNVNDEPLVTSPPSETLDETGFDAGANSADGTLFVDFGNDGPGTITPDGTFTISGSLPGGVLMSGGQVVTITATVDGYVGTLADGTVVFEFTIDAVTGEYVYTQFEPFDHADGADANDVITIEFGVVVTDSDGDTANTGVEVNVLDDVPTIEDSNAGTIDESGIIGTSSITVTGDLIEDSGEDVAAVISANDTFQVTGNVAGGLTSGGEAVTVTATADGYVGTLADGTVVFELTIDPITGEYAFTLNAPLDHADGSDLITLDFGVIITDFDGDTDEATITINVADSTPEIPNNTNPQIGEGQENIDETDTDGGPVSQSGTLPVDFGADGPGEVKGDGSFSVDGVTNLTSGGEPVSVSYDAANGVYTGLNAAGDVIFTLTIDPTTGEYTFTLIGQLDHPDGTDPNDVIQLQFGVCVTDGDGDEAVGQILINVFDDGPIAVDDTMALADNMTSVAGNITDNDDSGADVDATVTNVNFDGVDYPIVEGVETVITTPFGELTINADGSYEYVPNGTSTTAVSEEFTYTYTDADGDSVEAVLTITIPADDAPIIVAVTPLILDETDIGDTDTGVVTVDFGDDAPGTIEGNGVFDLNGLTSDGLPIDVTFDPATGTYTGVSGGDVIFTLTINADGTYSFNLSGNVDHPDDMDPNDAVQITFGVTATDADGDSADATITVTLLDDGPEATDDFNTVQEGDLVATGNVTDNDDSGFDMDASVVEISFNGTVVAVDPVNGATIDGQYGVLVINADGTYTYTSNGPTDSNVQDVFTYTYVDGDGDTVQADITITINGSDDQPIIVDIQDLVVDETDLDPTDTADGVITVDFGGDGPGTFAGDGTFNTNGLTSDGLPIEVSFDAATGTYTGTAGGEVIFTMTVNADGTYSFELLGVVDHPDTTDANDAVTIDFGVIVTDEDGDSASGDVTVTILDDGPQISNPDFQVVDETDLNSGSGLSISVDGTIDVDFGADGAGQIGPNGEFQAVDQMNGQPIVLTSGGETVSVVATAGGYVGTLPDGTVVFELTIDPATGDYTYTQFETLDHTDSTNPDDVLWLQFQVEVTDGDGDVDVATIVIDVHDDAPADSFVSGESVVDETDIGAGGVSVTDAVDIDFGADGFGSVEGNGNVDLNGLTSDGQPIDVSYDAASGTYTGTAGGEVIFTMTINADGTYTFTLLGAVDHPDTTDANDAVEIAFGITATDGDGDAIETNVNITILDDGPVASPFTSLPLVDETNLDSGSVSVEGTVEVSYGADGFGSTEGNGVTFGNLTSGGQPVNVSYDAASGTYTGTAGGEVIFTMVINADGTYSFTLLGAVDHPNTDSVNEAVGIGFGVTATDGDGDSVETFVNISILDDGPVSAATSSVSVDETGLDDGSESQSGVIDVDFGADGAGTITGDGTFDLGGLTSGGVAVVVSYDAASGTYTGSAGGSTVFTLVINADGTYTFTLLDAVDHPDATDPNDVLDIQFGYTATDGDGDSIDGSISINIFDDAPEAVEDTETFSTDDGGVSGDVTENDDLGNDDLTTVTSVSNGSETLAVNEDGSTTIEGDFGTLTINADGTYTYVLNADAGTTTIEFDPAAGDFAGFQNSVSMNGFTITGSFGQDLNWFSGPDGSGIGTGGDKIFGPNDYVEIGLDVPAESVTLSIADIGSNNVNGGIDFVVQLSDGSSVNYEANLGDYTVVNGVVMITLDSGMFGGLDITGLFVFSVNDSALGTTSFLINNIEATYPGGDTTDVFEYTITDADGDTSTTTITFNGDNPNGFAGDDDNGQVGEASSAAPDLDIPDQVEVPESEQAESVDAAQGAPLADPMIFSEIEPITQSDETNPALDNSDLFTLRLSDAWNEANATDFVFEDGGQNGEAEASEIALYEYTESDEVFYDLVEAAPQDSLSEANSFVEFAVSQGLDVITDFAADSGDVLDLSSVIQNYDPTQQAIDDFVFMTEVDGGTVLSVDVTGSGNVDNAVDLVALQGMHDVSDVQALVESGNIHIM